MPTNVFLVLTVGTRSKTKICGNFWLSTKQSDSKVGTRSPLLYYFQVLSILSVLK